MMRGTRSRGLSLIEVLVSVALLCAGAVFLSQSLANIAHANAVAEHQANAYAVAVSKMAELELAVREGQDLEDARHGTVVQGLQQIAWHISVEPLPDDPTRRNVALTVSWRDGGRAYERRVDTVMKVAAPQES